MGLSYFSGYHEILPRIAEHAVWHQRASHHKLQTPIERHAAEVNKRCKMMIYRTQTLRNLWKIVQTQYIRNRSHGVVHDIYFTLPSYFVANHELDHIRLIQCGFMVNVCLYRDSSSLCTVLLEISLLTSQLRRQTFGCLPADTGSRRIVEAV